MSGFPLHLTVEEWRAVASNVFLFGLILGMAGTIDVDEFRRRVTEWRGVLLGLFSQFVLLPVVGYAVVNIFDLDHVAGVTLLITTTSPGGGFSGLFCSLTNADLALSVAMTTASTMMCMVVMPLNCLLYIKSTYGVSVPLPWTSLFTTVGVVIAAVALGLLASYHKPQWQTRLNRAGTFCGICNVLLAGGANSGSEDPFWSHPPAFMAAVSLPCICGLLFSFAAATACIRLPMPQAVAVSIECCYQNTALAITVALSVFKEDAGYAAGIPLIYGLVEPLVIGPFCLLAWKLGWTYASPKAKFLTFLLGNWQPGSALNAQGPHRTEAAPASLREAVPDRKQDSNSTCADRLNSQAPRPRKDAEPAYDVPYHVTGDAHPHQQLL